MEKTIIASIQESNFVDAGKQIKKSLSENVLEQLANKKSEMLENFGDNLDENLEMRYSEGDRNKMFRHAAIMGKHPTTHEKHIKAKKAYDKIKNQYSKSPKNESINEAIDSGPPYVNVKNKEYIHKVKPKDKVSVDVGPNEFNEHGGHGTIVKAGDKHNVGDKADSKHFHHVKMHKSGEVIKFHPGHIEKIVKESTESINENKKRPYLAFYQEKKFELEAETALDAQNQAIAHFKPPKSKKHMVHAHLADVKHTPT